MPYPGPDLLPGSDFFPGLEDTGGSSPLSLVMPMPSNVAQRVRGYIPDTYMALASASYYGEDGIQRHIDSAKFRLFGTAVEQSLEDTTYNDFVWDFVAKVSTLRIIPSGADYWADQFTSESTPQQSINYPDRIDSLW